MSYYVKLSTEETYILADKMKEITNKKLSRRLLAVSLRHFGYKMKDIALLTGVSEKTVTTWIKLFLEGGFDLLLAQNYIKDRDSRLTPHKKAIQKLRKDNPDIRLIDIQDWLNEKHGIEVEQSWLYRYIEHHGL
jgi:transposase